MDRSKCRGGECYICHGSEVGEDCICGCVPTRELLRDRLTDVRGAAYEALQLLENPVFPNDRDRALELLRDAASRG